MNNEKYKTRCDKCFRGTWYEKEQPCKCNYPKTKTCNKCNHSEELLDEDECPIMERCKGTLRFIDKYGFIKEDDTAVCVWCGNIQDKKWDSCQECFHTHIDEEGLHSIEIK